MYSKPFKYFEKGSILSLPEDWGGKTEIVFSNCELHKMVLQSVPNECPWHEKWPVSGYVGIESVQSSSQAEITF